jgi:heme exporter protein D
VSLGSYLQLLQWGAYAAFAAILIGLANVVLLALVLGQIMKRR